MESKCSFTLGVWSKSPTWDSELDSDKALFLDFLREAQKSGLKREFVKELVDLQVNEFRADSSSEDRAKLLKSFYHRIDCFYNDFS
jgi:hypothetical protein